MKWLTILNHFSHPTIQTPLMGKCPTKIYFLFLVLVTSLMLPASMMAALHVDDFEYPTPGSNNFITNGIFNHNILPYTGDPLGSEHWEIGDFGPPPTGDALDLWPALDEITFNLGPGEYVDYAAIDATDWAGGNTFFEVIGTDTYSVPIISASWNDWVFVDTTGQNLGHITMIKLSSREGGFDNLTINVVPEPGTVLLFGLGGLVLRKKR